METRRKVKRKEKIRKKKGGKQTKEYFSLSLPNPFVGQRNLFSSKDPTNHILLLKVCFIRWEANTLCSQTPHPPTRRAGCCGWELCCKLCCNLCCEPRCAVRLLRGWMGPAPQRAVSLASESPGKSRRKAVQPLRQKVRLNLTI